MAEKDPYRIYLSEDQIPTAWYNLRADMPNKPGHMLLPDGTPAENVIHVTAEGVYMEDSTCENHDCVDQGEVTLDNRKDRILGNMIICLPNQVTLQLLTPDEVLEMFGKQE